MLCHRILFVDCCFCPGHEYFCQAAEHTGRREILFHHHGVFLGARFSFILCCLHFDVYIRQSANVTSFIHRSNTWKYFVPEKYFTPFIQNTVTTPLQKLFRYLYHIRAT